MSQEKLPTNNPEVVTRVEYHEQQESKWRHSIWVKRPLDQDISNTLKRQGQKNAFPEARENKAQEFFFPSVVTFERQPDIGQSIVTFVAREVGEKDGKMKKTLLEYLEYLGFGYQRSRNIAYQLEQELTDGQPPKQFFENLLTSLLQQRWNNYWRYRVSTIEADQGRGMVAHKQHANHVSMIEGQMAQGVINASGGVIKKYENTDPINDYLDATDVLFKTKTTDSEGKPVMKLIAAQLTFSKHRPKLFHREDDRPIRIEDTSFITFPEHLEYGEMPLVLIRGGAEAIERLEKGADNADPYNAMLGRNALANAADQWYEDIVDQLETKTNRLPAESVRRKKMAGYADQLSQAFQAA